MSNADEIRNRFVSFFVDDHGYYQNPGNTGPGRTVLSVCGEAMRIDTPFLHETILDWDEHGKLKTKETNQEVKLLNIALNLLTVGQWEGAWAVCQTHYDQLLKTEVSSSKREHKGHPLCNLALIGQALGSHSLIRHYAQLSSVGDIYWETNKPELAFGGLGPTILERYESNAKQEKWLARIRKWLADVNKDEPQYLEAYLAAQWFGDERAKGILEAAGVIGNEGKPFVEVLLHSVENSTGTSDSVKGTRFEAAAGLLFSATPGFEVRSARQEKSEQVDFVVWYERDPLTVLPLASGPGLVECKSSTGKVTSKELRDFGAKCQFHRVGFGILVARTGITGDSKDLFEEPTGAELIRRRLLVDGLPVLVLKSSDLHEKARQLRGLQDVLTADHDQLVFGPIAGE